MVSFQRPRAGAGILHLQVKHKRALEQKAKFQKDRPRSCQREGTRVGIDLELQNQGGEQQQNPLKSMGKGPSYFLRKGAVVCSRQWGESKTGLRAAEQKGRVTSTKAPATPPATVIPVAILVSL